MRVERDEMRGVDSVYGCLWLCFVVVATHGLANAICIDGVLYVVRMDDLARSIKM